jgi:hypothetical protein
MISIALSDLDRCVPPIGRRLRQVEDGHLAPSVSATSSNNSTIHQTAELVEALSDNAIRIIDEMDPTKPPICSAPKPQGSAYPAADNVAADAVCRYWRPDDHDFLALRRRMTVADAIRPSAVIVMPVRGGYRRAVRHCHAT